MTSVGLSPTTQPSSRFWDRIAERYARTPVSDEAAYQKKLEITRGFLRPDMEILEIGCGTGSTAIAHAPFVKRVLATDLSSKMLAIAQAKAEAEGVENVVFERVAAENLAAPEASFDAVLALSLLHLLDDRDAVIAKVARLLKPGGVFVTNTACLEDTMSWFKLVAPIGRLLGFFPLVRSFGSADLQASLERHGFRIDHHWRPGKGPTVFCIATKPEGSASSV